jgi:hypothetical protein
MNNIIDETVMTADAVLGGSGGSGGLDIASGKLSISANAINNSRLATNSVTSANIVDGTIVNADINASAAIAGTKISPSFGNQGISTTRTAADFNSLDLINTSGVQVSVNANGNSEGNLRTVTNHPLTLSTNNAERMRIATNGNVGIGTSSPNAKLDVAGGAIRIQGAGGEGGQLELLNAANNDVQAIFDVDPNDLTRLWTLPSSVLSLGTTSGEKMRIDPDGNVGIGTTTPSSKLQVNGTVTATEFSGPLTGNASSASTVSNSAITAAKLDGNQSDSAPIFGVRAWANIDGTVGSVSVRQGGNVSGVVRNQLGRYTITFSTPMQDTNYAIIAWARDANATDNNYFVSAASNATKTTGSFLIEVNSPGGTVDSPEIGIMVIR